MDRPTTLSYPTGDTRTAGESQALKAAAIGYQTPTLRSAFWQIANSVVPFIAVSVASYYALFAATWWSWALMVPLAIVGGGLVVRIFIIQHDCGHGSFFKSERANQIVGFCCGLFTFTPFVAWARQHAGHHAHWNNLDRRNTGVDIYSTCVTLDEYRAMTPRQRMLLRVVRTPLVYLLLIPPLVFLVLYRLPFDTPKDWHRERRSVHATNFMLLAAFVALGIPLGFGAVALVQLPMICVASIVGVFLFSVQHRFETTLWARREEWSSVDASLQGSSFLRLTPVLRWFTGNIGYHHVHHLNSRVPNYRLRAAHDGLALDDMVPALGLGGALANHRNALWDEDRQRMVSFRAASRMLA